MTRVLETFPVEPVLAYLGEVPDSRGRYWCPWHEDRLTGRPSADVWGEEDDVLGCWSCGRHGDAVDLVMTVERVCREEALAIVRQVVQTWVPPQRRRAPAPSPDRLEAELRRLTTDVRYPHDVDPLVRWQRERDLPNLEYLRSWGWVGDYRGRVVMPHRTATGVLTGLRFRVPPDWRKDGRRGSRFQQLYGVWRLRDVGEIWLTEGETDATWAGWHLEPEGVGVVALPGASFLPGDADLELFEDRAVVLALDPDAAGELATERWADAIQPRCRELDVLRFSDGKDLSQRDPLAIRRRLRGEEA